MANTHYVGKSGQFAVMAELSHRGYNVAIPEIDIGDDVFVVNHATGALYRIQVKTANARRLSQSRFAGKFVYSCQFKVSEAHVHNAVIQGNHYVLVARCDQRWRFLVFDRAVLSHLVKAGWGSKTSTGEVMLSVTFFSSTKAAVSSKKGATDLSGYAGIWNTWPAQ